MTIIIVNVRLLLLLLLLLLTPNIRIDCVYSNYNIVLKIEMLTLEHLWMNCSYSVGMFAENVVKDCSDTHRRDRVKR